MQENPENLIAERQTPGAITKSAATLLRLAAAALLLGACGDSPPPAEPQTIAENPRQPACIDSGRLRTDLRGAIHANIDWPADAMSCEGMRRPAGEGARLRFSGQLNSGDEQQTLVFILGLPDLRSGLLGRELPTNVTLVEEGNGRFFATPDLGSCWTDIMEHQSFGSAQDFRLAGTLYCVSPLAEIGGNADISFTELSFSGQLSWADLE